MVASTQATDLKTEMNFRQIIFICSRFHFSDLTNLDILKLSAAFFIQYRLHYLKCIRSSVNIVELFL